MIIQAGSLGAGIKVKESAGSDQPLSKAVSLGCNYRLFWRIQEINAEGDKDIVTPVVPGRSLSFDVFRSTYFMYNDADLKFDEVTGFPDDLTVLPRWSRIARVLHNAACTREIKMAEAEAKRSAEELGKEIDQVTLARKREGIEIKYHGGEAADGTKVMPSVSPIISGLQSKMTSQLAVVQILPDGKPDWKNAKYAVLELSKARAQEIANLRNNPEHFWQDRDYLEVGYSYIGADKKAAGRAAKFVGITRETSLENQFPDDWAKFGKAFIDGLAHGDTINDTAQAVAMRNGNLRRSLKVQDIVSQFKKYCATNQGLFGSIDFEDEATGAAATDILGSGLLDSLPKIKEQFEAIVAAREEGNTESKETTNAEVAAAQATAVPEKVGPTLEELEKQEVQSAAQAAALNPDQQTMSQVLSQLPNVEFSSDDDLGEL